MKKIIIIDFGGQYKQLIARRVRECKVYSEIIDYQKALENIDKNTTAGIILTGGPNSVYLPKAPIIPKRLFELNIPILGICYGMQVIAYLFNKHAVGPNKGEYGQTKIQLSKNVLFDGMKQENVCWMNHKDMVVSLSDGFVNIAKTVDCPNAAMANDEKKIYATQFHPEASTDGFGKQIFENFLFKVCQVKPEWNLHSFIEQKINEIRDVVQQKNAICALSGGVDSTVAAVMVQKAIGNQLQCVFVDHGLLRLNEAQQVRQQFNQLNLNVRMINAHKLFLDALRKTTDPEQKRKKIGKLFIQLFEQEIKKTNNSSFLVQGTIYPDVVESGGGANATIKSHHNVGGLPKNMKLKLVEPLRELFKDEVREIGLMLGIPREIIFRQPFPGPGLAVRILGEVTPAKIKIVQKADKIFTDEIFKAGLNTKIWQYFACLLNIKSVGMKGDQRIHQYVIALRAVNSTDAMTATSYPIPFELLEYISKRITNEIDEVSRVVYDISSKPPATIEWE